MERKEKQTMEETKRFKRVQGKRRRKSLRLGEVEVLEEGSKNRRKEEGMERSENKAERKLGKWRKVNVGKVRKLK